MSKTVAVTGYFKKNEHGVYELRNDEIFNAIRNTSEQDKSINIFVLDWHSISEGAQVRVFDLHRSCISYMSLTAFDLIHILRLGYGSNKQFTLSQKWSEFKSKLGILKKLHIKTINSVPALEYGLSKHYLLDLHSKGIPIPSTQIISSSIRYEDLKEVSRFPSDIIKPVNGECGHLVFQRNQINEEIFNLYKVNCNEIVIQKFVSSIKNGEKSLLFCNGDFVFASIKKPHKNNFKSNGSHVGARISQYTPTKDEILFCKRVASIYKEKLMIFRVDILAEGSKFYLMELESVDPGFYVGNYAELSRLFFKIYCKEVNL